MKLGLISLSVWAAVCLAHGQTNAPPVNIIQPSNLVPASILAWDADATQGLKQYDAKAGEANAFFTFWVTNVSPSDVSINSVSTSCGCTVAQLPSQPWVLKPGANGPIKVTVDLHGRYGTVMKGVTVNSSAGVKALVVRANVPQPTNASPGFAVPISTSTAGVLSPPPPAMMSTDRAHNLQLALADRQAVLKGDCARCHVEPGRDKLGLALYTAACGICHDAQSRAAMVPDLRKPSQARTPEFWRKIIAEGRPGSLMPAFALAEHGSLTDRQIESLVEYLDQNFPRKPETGNVSVPTSLPQTPAPAAGSSLAPRRKW